MAEDEEPRYEQEVERVWETLTGSGRGRIRDEVYELAIRGCYK